MLSVVYIYFSTQTIYVEMHIIMYFILLTWRLPYLDILKLGISKKILVASNFLPRSAVGSDIYWAQSSHPECLLKA